MDERTIDRRQPYLLNPQGSPLLPGRIVHDRRRQKVVEELLDAMRAGARTAGRPAEIQEPAKSQRFGHRGFWLTLAGLIMAFLIVAFIARWAAHSSESREAPLGVGAVYGWMGFHRSSPVMP